jgi:hypothetical protein
MLLCAVLLLGACQSQVEPSPRPSGSVSAVPSLSPSSSAAPTGATSALLDGLVVPQQPGRYAPHDECGKLPGAREFREKLAAAVLARDVDAIAGMAAPEVKLGFGGDDGRARLLTKLKEPDSEVMRELGVILSLGCAATGEGGMTFPWHFAQEVGDVDGYDAMVVTGADVSMLVSPDPKAVVRKRLSWDMVELVAGLYPERPFQQVKAADGMQGYVATDKLRSLLDYRLLADREKGEWRIGAILAGD